MNKSQLKTFYFDTGVKVNHDTVMMPGQIVSSNFVKLIPFDCEGVPKGAVFKFACDETPPHCEHLLKFEIKNSSLVSKYAFFHKA